MRKKIATLLVCMFLICVFTGTVFADVAEAKDVVMTGYFEEEMTSVTFTGWSLWDLILSWITSLF